MTFDRFAALSVQWGTDTQQLVELDIEAQNLAADKKKRKEREEKEAQADKKRSELLESCPHLCYHALMVSRKESADKLRSAWAMKNISVEIPDPDWSGWNNISAPAFNLSILPKYSFAIQFTFKLAKPFISQDEQEFYIIDNPVRKDKVFGLPYVAPSSWKGSLRSALWQLGYKEENEQIQRTFGNERASEDEAKFRKGRLHFYPTFFNKKSLEVINPHDREKRVGSFPIYFESVRVDAEGTFSLLYIPFDMIGANKNENKIQIASDLKLICEGLRAMLTIYGFGAKTSSGFGSAKSELADGKIILKVEGIETHRKEEVKFQPPEERFAKYLYEDGSVKEEFKGSGEADLLSNSEYGEKGQQLGGGSFSEFKRFRRWYSQYAEQWQKYIKSKNAPQPEWPTWTFESFDEMLKRADEIRGLLIQKEGELSDF